MRRILAEPLVHFLLLGAALFALSAVLGNGPSGRPSGDGATIVVDGAVTDRLAETFQGAWGRAPDPDDLEAMVQAHITDEVLVREARARGLDHGDWVIRQRLREKMDVVLSAELAPPEPEEAILRAFHAADPARFASTARIALSQVYLGPEEPGAARVQAALRALRAGEAPVVRSRLPSRIGLSPPEAVDGLLGQGVFEQVSAFPLGLWQGPVASGHGFHLIRVDQRTDAVQPSFEAVRDRVARAWREDQMDTARTAHIEALRAGYRIRRDD